MRLAEREDIFEGLSILLISLPQFLSAQTSHITLQFTAKCLHILLLPTTVGQLSASDLYQLSQHLPGLSFFSHLRYEWQMLHFPITDLPAFQFLHGIFVEFQDFPAKASAAHCL